MSLKVFTLNKHGKEYIGTKVIYNPLDSFSIMKHRCHSYKHYKIGIHVGKTPAGARSLVVYVMFKNCEMDVLSRP